MSGAGAGPQQDAAPPEEDRITGGGVTESAGLVEAHISVLDTDAAQRIATDLVARQLAACVQMLGPMTSVYAWQGEVHRNEEWLLVAKTTAQSFPALAQAVRELHSYDVPEVIAVPISQALADYARWVWRRADGQAEPS